MALIKDNQVVDDPWQAVDPADTLPESDALLFELTDWQSRRDLALARGGAFGIRLAPADDPAEIAADLDRLHLVAVDFPSFADGRGFSTARLLRERYGYAGEIRAIGQVIPDQVQFLRRCGFDSWEIADSAVPALTEGKIRKINVNYQPATDTHVAAVRHSHVGAAAE